MNQQQRSVPSATGSPNRAMFIPLGAAAAPPQLRAGSYHPMASIRGQEQFDSRAALTMLHRDPACWSSLLSLAVDEQPNGVKAQINAPSDLEQSLSTGTAQGNREDMQSKQKEAERKILELQAQCKSLETVRICPTTVLH